MCQRFCQKEKYQAKWAKNFLLAHNVDAFVKSSGKGKTANIPPARESTNTYDQRKIPVFIYIKKRRERIIKKKKSEINRKREKTKSIPMKKWFLSLYVKEQ